MVLGNQFVKDIVAKLSEPVEKKRNQQLSLQKLISIALDRAIDEKPVDDKDVDAKDILEGRK